MKALPLKFQWAEKETAPKIWLEARKHYGLLEHVGAGSNPNILQWATEVGVRGWYTDDDIPWCSLFVAVVLKRCGYEIPAAGVVLGARSFKTWGNTVAKEDASWMDILVFSRPGGNHVGFYHGENKDSYLVYGGNQKNAVGYAWIEKSRCIAVRRCKWKIGQPASVRKIFLTYSGELSTNEA